MHLEIKTTNTWQTINLSPDASITLDFISWVWDTKANGAFTHVFDIPVKQNIHLFGNATSVNGQTFRQVLQGKKARLSYKGFIVIQGVIRIDDEAKIEDGNFPVEIAADGQDFNDIIEDMKCSEVEIKDKICLGTTTNSLDLYTKIKYNNDESKIIEEAYRLTVPENVFTSNFYEDNNGSIVDSVNVTMPYPEKKYCNVRICLQHREKDSSGNYKETREYDVFEADRPDTGPCFYVLYFLDCLFKKTGFSFDNSELTKWQDLCRLAFFNTQQHYSTEYADSKTDPFNTFFDGCIEQMKVWSEYDNDYHRYIQLPTLQEGIRPYLLRKYATAKNMPDTEVDNVIEALTNAFGVRFRFDSQTRSCKAFMLKDILEDKDILPLKAEVLDVQKIESHNDAFILSYSGNEDDSAYNYDVNDSAVKITDSYDNIRLMNLNPHDENAYYDTTTGNMYRIKVDDDATTEEELHPSLFQVNQFGQAWVGDKDSEHAMKVEIGFTPVEENVIEYTTETTRAGKQQWTTSKQGTTGGKPKYAVFIDQKITDVEEKLLQVEFKPKKIIEWTDRRIVLRVSMKYKQRYGFSDDYLNRLKDNWGKKTERIAATRSEPIPLYNQSPFQEYDPGLAFVIMRGPGNESGIETFDQDYDGEGNEKYMLVANDYTTNNDSIDLQGNAYDYNGTTEGGVDYSGRFSLKLTAKKRRGVPATKPENGIFVARTKEDAKYWLDRLLGVMSMDILNMRLVNASDLNNAGYQVQEGRVYAAMPVDILTVTDLLGTPTYRIINAFTPEGLILDKQTLEECKQNPESYELFSHEYLDRFTIAGSDSPFPENIFQHIIGLTDVYYGLAESYALEGVTENSLDKFYPINANNANRGLFETFHTAHAYITTHAKHAVMTAKITIADLLNLKDKIHKKYQIANQTIYIKKIECSISDKGLSEATITYIYL